MSRVLHSLFRFVRSVLPADSKQLLFLSGVVCLFIAPHLNWWPSDLFGRTAPLGATWRILSFVASSLVNFSGAAGYYLCFWPGKYPLRRILWWVCFPAILGFALSFGLIFHFARITGDQFSSGPFIFWKLGVGSHFTLFGLILIVLFTALLPSGIASLPLTLPELSVFCSDDAASWRPAQAVIWMQLATVGALEIVIGLLLSGLLYPLTYIHSLNHFILLVSKTLPVLSAITTVVVLVGLAVWITGTEGRRGLRDSFRLPWPESFAIALAFPVGIANTVSLAHYLIARADWAAQQVAKFAQPQLLSYLRLPNVYFLLGLVPALAEEIIFRGTLQPRFIRRYGLLRGLFLVSTAWAASHFFVDFSSLGTYGAIFLKFSGRLLQCWGMGFVLGWLTLRTGSVLPAAVAHSLENALVYSLIESKVRWESTAIVLLWFLLAVALFHFWPIGSGNAGEQTPQAAANGQPAV